MALSLQEKFAQMDSTGNGYVTLDEWLKYAFNHIAEKAAKV